MDLKEKLSQNNISIQGREYDVDLPNNLNEAAMRGVLVTPTIIFYNKDNKEIARTHTIDEVKSVLSL